MLFLPYIRSEMKKKVGTALEERLLFEAKKAALEDRVPIQSIIEKALEKYLQERSTGSGAGKASRKDRISENGAAYQTNTNVLEPVRPEVIPVSITPEERWKRASALSGKYRSGRSDISARHDEFAAEAFGK